MTSKQKPIEAQVVNLREVAPAGETRRSSRSDASGPAEKFVDDTSKQVKGIAREIDNVRRAVGGFIDKVLELPDDGRGEPPER